MDFSRKDYFIKSTIVDFRQLEHHPPRNLRPQRILKIAPVDAWSSRLGIDALWLQPIPAHQDHAFPDVTVFLFAGLPLKTLAYISADPNMQKVTNLA